MDSKSLYIVLLSSFLSIYPLTASAQLRSCDHDTECRLVQESWCLQVQSIAKNSYSQWVKNDQKTYAESQDMKQTCKTASEATQNMDNYRSKCIKQICTAIYTPPKEKPRGL